jgi:hypothetical protein
MNRIARPTWFSLLLLGAVIPVGAACSPSNPDTAQAVLADCDRPDLPDSAVDSCLERARVMDETSPSPEMHTLVATLSRRPYGQAPGYGTAQEGPPPQPYEQTSADEPPSGDYGTDDQPLPDMSDDTGPPDDDATAPDMDQDMASGDEPPGDDAMPDDQPPSDQEMSPDDNDPGPPDMSGPPDSDSGPPPPPQ